MPAGNFDEKLTVTKNGTVNATGPLDPSVKAVTELCVWVLQRDGTNDAIANAMGMPDMPDMPDMRSDLKISDVGKATARWTFPLTNRFKPVDFRAGSATASAFGVFVDGKGRQKAFFWSEPVRLTGPGTKK